MMRIGGSVEAKKVLTKVQPVYPESAKAAGAQGTVVLHAAVGMDGKLLSLQVLNSQINGDLARAAEAVSQWRYQPTLLNGEPVAVDTVITVNFKLWPSDAILCSWVTGKDESALARIRVRGP